MASDVIAYIGINSFDLILYQACVLTKLQKKVLIIEKNEKVEQCPFSCMLQVPLGLKEKEDIISFHRIDFAFFQPEMDLLKNYDIVFISAGFSKLSDEFPINREIYVTDLYVQNMEAVKHIMSKSLCTRRTIVIRNNVFSSINLDLLNDEMEGLIDKSEMVIIDMNENDHYNALLCQNGQSLKFKFLSINMKKYLLREIRQFCPEVGHRVLHIAYKAASKGGVT